MVRPLSDIHVPGALQRGGLHVEGPPGRNGCAEVRALRTGRHGQRAGRRAAKDAALGELRTTAPDTIIQYEYYVPLLVPFDGTVQDKVHRRNASGDIIDNNSVIPSVFNRKALQIAQSLCCEVIRPPMSPVAVRRRTGGAGEERS